MAALSLAADKGQSTGGVLIKYPEKLGLSFIQIFYRFDNQ